MPRSSSSGTRRIIHKKFDSTTPASTTSTTYVVIASSSFTPPPGKYLVIFSSTGKGSASAQQMEYAIRIGGTVVGHTERRLDWNSGSQGNELWLSMHTQEVFVTDGTDLVEIVYKTNTGTFTVGPRSLLGIKLR